jgi:hypothetical protein
MTSNADRLYELLPVVHKMRDAEQGYPLRALLQVAGEQFAAIEDNIGQLYDNWFIETCEDWVVPYLAALTGYRPVAAAGLAADGAGALAKILTPRGEAANTLAYRRRKGSLALLELLANKAAGWPARAVEFYTLLGRAQNISHLQMRRGFSASFRDAGALDLLDTPFDKLAHSVDVRRVNSARTPGRFNIQSVGVFVWRLKSYSVTHGPAYCQETQARHCFSFSALGNDTPLFSCAKPETDPAAIADEINVPSPIRRRALEQRSKKRPFSNSVSKCHYGEGRSLAVYAPGWPQKDSPQPVPAKCISVADLSGWKARPPAGRIAVDPALGRIVFPSRQLPQEGVYVDYRYGFSADMGGGEYPRALSQPLAGSCVLYVVSRDPGTKEKADAEALSSINAALAKWRSDLDTLLAAEPAGDSQEHLGWLAGKNKLRAAVIEIQDSAAYTEQLAIELGEGEYLQIRAASGKRPVIRLLDHSVERPDGFSVRGKRASRFKLDGILVAGRGLRISGPFENTDKPSDKGDLCDVVIRHCTLVPGWWLDCNCAPAAPHEASIALFDSSARLTVEHSIIGAIHVTASERAHDPVKVAVSDSIVDATHEERPAVCAPNLPLAFAEFDIRRSTIIGTVATHAITLAENSIFTGKVQVGRRQIGCMRYCFISPDSRTPRRHRCQPDALEKQEAVQMRPQFNSLRCGQPAYGQLALTCAVEIRRGADDESEMGAFHDLFQPQREAILAARLYEYTPADMRAGILFAS